MNSNRTEGNHFESELCEIFGNHGWWCHNLAQNRDGQPADVIALKGKTAVLIDCKLLKGNRFPLDRVETNQEMSMERWMRTTSFRPYFAIKIEDTVYMVAYTTIKLAQFCRHKSLSLSDITASETLEQFLRRYDED